MNPINPSFAEDVAGSFAQQPIMNLIGARLSLVEPGVVEITLPYRADLAQQHGYLHAGVVATIADSAGGYAAFTLMPAGSNVLSVEFKVNLLRPAQCVEFFTGKSERRDGEVSTGSGSDRVSSARPGPFRVLRPGRYRSRY